jgi:hypothetical protein
LQLEHRSGFVQWPLPKEGRGSNNSEGLLYTAKAIYPVQVRFTGKSRNAQMKEVIMKCLGISKIYQATTLTKHPK